MIGTPLSELDLTDIRSAMAELRVARVRHAVRTARTTPPSNGWPRQSSPRR